LKARQTKSTSESKGVAEDLSSFLNCYLDEAKTAAYLRFSNLGDFRRMKLSYPVIKAFLQLRKDRFGWAKKVLEKIRETTHLDEEFLPGVDPVIRYPVKEGTLEDESERQNNEHNKTMQFTMVIAELVRTLQAWEHINLAEKKVQQATIVQEFQAATGLTFPSDIYQVVKVPAAFLTADGKIGEHQLETYNRAIQLVKNMARTCRPEAWDPVFGAGRKSKTPFRRTDCCKSATSWMTSGAADAMVNVKASQPLHRCKATPLLKRKLGKELYAHVDEVDGDETPIQSAEVTKEKASKPLFSYNGMSPSERKATKVLDSHVDEVDDDETSIKTEAILPTLSDLEERPDRYHDAMSVLDQCKKSQMRLNRISVARKYSDHDRTQHFDDNDTPWLKLLTDYIDKEHRPFSLILQFVHANGDGSMALTDVSPQQLQETIQQSNADTDEALAKATRGTATPALH